MASLFAARRKPKRNIRQDEGSHKRDSDQDEEEDTGPLVHRPTTSQNKVKSRLRISFNPDDATDTRAQDLSGQSEYEVETFSRAKSGRTQAKRRTQLDIFTNRIDREEGNSDFSRPSYSKAYLDELRNSTPSTPRDLSAYGTPVEEMETDALDIAGKFGVNAPTTPSQNNIPSTAEIREKKERRARLAKEQAAAAATTTSGASEDFISLEDYDSDGEFKPRRMQLSTYVQRERLADDTRLVRDDEDIMEGFDEFVEDSGKVTLGRKGLKEQSRKEREQIRALIDQAEGFGGSGSEEDEEEDNSETERRHAYEEAQTHYGMAGRGQKSRHSKRPRQPRDITPIPKPGKGLERLREMIQRVEFEKSQLMKRRADLEKERLEIIANQEHIQKSLEEAGRELEKIQVQADLRGDDTGAAVAIHRERGLETLARSTTDMQIETNR